jgi:hypothetical protein
MILALRIPKQHSQLLPRHIYPSELQIDEEHSSNHLPWLCATFKAELSQSVDLIVRVHNKAGVPIIEGKSRLEAGQKQVVFDTLQPLGIEAYAHYTDEQRAAIVQRIWSRRAYCTITPAHQTGQ